MKSHRVELPNGTLITIEGGDARQVANFINNRLVHTQAHHIAERSETPMLMPTINFKTEAEPVTANTDGELPLEMPVLNFA